MRYIAFLVILAGFLLPLMASTPASAQATRTWVSGVGDDANPCNRTAPCKTFAGAISKTAAKGEINCLDPAGFGALTIIKAVTISCQIGTAGVLVAGTNGIVVAAAASDVVVLKGLDFVGSNTGLAGIKFQSGAALHVEDCIISGFTGFGIAIVPTNAATFSITRTTLMNNAGGGIQVRPSSGFTSGVIEKSNISRNGTGISVDGAGGGSGQAVSIRDTMITGNINSGVNANSAVVSNTVIMESTISNNLTGLVAASSSVVRVGSSVIAGNSTAASGANVLTYGTNELNGNGVDTVLTPVPGGLH